MVSSMAAVNRNSCIAIRTGSAKWRQEENQVLTMIMDSGPMSLDFAISEK
eukprot:CAMPEP_0184728292 /NCGR_PEP_ID=MMETSP0314-20130426/39613_1 /TAXON_ID=38298 /ORGANISM="Rhodella maculata, Strain CCMP 736" /LENGTH=49 /DNA_ID=CAMNT_0027194101 /DNA_START=261 /DNA_END=410 /DNA_ORIENTATION=+